MVFAILLLALTPIVIHQFYRPVTPCGCAEEQVLEATGKPFDEDYASRCDRHMSKMKSDEAFFIEFESCLFSLWSDILPIEQGSQDNLEQ